MNARRLSGAAGILATIVVAMIAEAEMSTANTLTGVAAQKSPQATAFLAYEETLLSQGIDAASVYMTAARLADMKAMVEQFGEDGFKEFQAQQRQSTPQGEARRQQIEKVVVDGDTAVLTARSGPNMVDEVRLVRVGETWKIEKGR